MPEILINSKKINYNITGSGTPLLLLHDGFYNTTSWDTVRNELSESYLVIDYDRFGYGKSDKYTEAIHDDIIKLNSEELSLFIKHLNLKDFFICGHCLGGAIALDYILNNPGNKVKKLIAESVGYYSDHKLLVKSDFTFKPFTRIDKILKRNLIKMNGKEYADKFWKIISNNKNSYIMSEEYNILNQLKKIKIPVFIINGDRDFYFDPDHPAAAFKKLKTADLWIVPDTGHVPHIEKKDDFIKNVIMFLKK